MAYFLLLCEDKPNHLQVRLDTRASHLAYIDQHAEAVLLAGPMLGDDQKPVGSMLLLEVEDLKAAEHFAENDPYAQAGLFADVHIRPYAISVNSFAK
jgi:hypothetical protein